MNVHWDALLAVFGVSLGSAVGVVALVTVALVGLSARSARPAAPDLETRRPLLSPRVGTVVAAVCLTAAAAIVLFGLWVLVVR
jgi:hypothetical protein